MRVWRLRYKEPRSPFSNPEEDGHEYFHKDKTGPNLATVYKSEDAARRAKQSVYQPDLFEIVAFTMEEERTESE